MRGSKRMVKRVIAFAMSLAMVAGMTITVSAEEATANAAGYEVGKIYVLNENEFANKGDAVSGYEWNYTEISAHVDGYVDYENCICTTEEHVHADAAETDCRGWEYTCTAEEHTHNSATEADCMGWELACTIEEHTHSSASAEDCSGWEYTCTTEEHTHSSASAEDCQGWEFDCQEPEHEHGKDACSCTITEHTHDIWGCGYFFGWLCGDREHTHSDKCCNISEHTHSDYAGACYVQKSCELEEHVHSDYAGACYTQKVCDVEEHVHSDYAGACYVQKSCELTEHVHSDYAGECYTQKICNITEHTHNDNCYAYVEPVLAVYRCQMIPTGSNNVTNGNERITVTVNVKCKDGAPANGVKVKVKAVDILDITDSRYFSSEATTGLNGVATFKISSRFDYVISVTAEVNGSTVTIFDDKEWISNYENGANYDYTISEHNYVLDQASVKEATLVDNGYTGDQNCSHCGEKVEGEVIPKTGVNVAFTGTKNNSDKTIAVLKGTEFGSIADKPVDTKIYHYNYERITFNAWALNGVVVEDSSVMNDDIAFEALYGSEADTNVIFYMLKPQAPMPEGTVSAPSSDFTEIGRNMSISADATVTNDKNLVSSYFEQDDLYGEGAILAPYTKTVVVGEENVIYQKAEIFRTMYITGSGSTAGWHADCLVRDIEGNTVNPDESAYCYVFFCDEDGNALVNENGAVEYRVIEMGGSLEQDNLPVAPEKAEDELNTYSFAGWYQGEEEAGFENINAEVMVVKAAYTATEKEVVSDEDNTPDGSEDTTGENDITDGNDVIADENDTATEEDDDAEEDDSANDGDETTVEAVTAEATTTAPATTVPATVVEEPVEVEENDVVTIEDEEAPLADQVEEEISQQEPVQDVATVVIEDEEAPLAAHDHNCIIHWIMLGLTVLFMAYNAMRFVARNKKNDEMAKEA